MNRSRPLRRSLLTAIVGITAAAILLSAVAAAFAIPSGPLARALLLLLAVCLLGIAAALAYWQARRIARPLAALTASARRLGDGDFTIRADPSGIAEADEAGLAVQNAAERLGRRLDRERAFTADVSHQLRTPLTVLLLGLESALMRPDADLRDAAERALQQGRRLQQIIEDLLHLARERHRAEAVLDIDRLLHDIRTRWHGPFAAGGRDLVLAAEPDLPPAASRQAAVRQILDVLLDNALTHGAGRTRVDVGDSGHGIAIRVADEGPGIAPDAPDVFRRRHEPTGHGIGLALARSLAEADGARLELSRRSPHPVFTLWLPAAGQGPS